MRLWTLHPRYLDRQGLLALWREGLLARKVLAGGTRGYRHHPQLQRFRDAPDPTAAIAAYLLAVCDEAARRGYAFDRAKLGSPAPCPPLAATRGQLRFEWEHLGRKLRARSPAAWRAVRAIKRPRAHPLFRIVPGPVAEWERASVRPKARTRAARTTTSR